MRLWRFSILLAATLAVAQQLPFKVEMTPARLSNHQRLQASIIVRIDAKELAKRNGEGALEIEVEIVDRKGQRYRQRGSAELKEISTDPKRPDMVYVLDFFVLPGSYTAYVSVGDTASAEGTAARHAFVVAPLTNDPLPKAWRDLPPIEYLAVVDPPDKWFQPGLNGRLHLPIQTTHPVKIDLLVHITPTEAIGVNGRISDLNMSTLLPALKAMADMEPMEGVMNMSVLDSTRSKIIFSQAVVADINWSGLSDALRGSDPNMVDVKALENRQKRADFFLSEVSRRVAEARAPDEPPHILIVLSGPMIFGDKVSLHPIAESGNENCKVFYIRYSWGLRPPPARRTATLLTTRPPGPINNPPNNNAGRNNGNTRNSGPDISSVPVTTVEVMPQPSPEDDSLEATLKPLKPRLFNVDSPISFRRALAELLAEIAKM